MVATAEATTRAPSADELLSTNSSPLERFDNESGGANGEQNGADPLATTTPEEDPRNKPYEEEDPLEKQKRREKKEFIAVLVVSFVILVVVVVTTTVLVVKNQNTDKGTQPEKAQTGSPTTAPTTYPVPTPQEKLDYLSWDITHNNFTAGYMSDLSTTASDMYGKYRDPLQPPVVRAMSWLLDEDTNNQEGNLLRRLGLASVYFSNGGDDWFNATNWLTDVHHCSWSGVQCCSAKHLRENLVACAEGDRNTIVELNLSMNNVTGSITNTFAFLKDLRALDLSYNSMVGTLPGEMLGSLPYLLQLYLQHNDFTGTVPATLKNNGVFGTCRPHHDLHYYVLRHHRAVLSSHSRSFVIFCSRHSVCAAQQPQWLMADIVLHECHEEFRIRLQGSVLPV